MRLPSMKIFSEANPGSDKANGSEENEDKRIRRQEYEKKRQRNYRF